MKATVRFKVKKETTSGYFLKKLCLQILEQDFLKIKEYCMSELGVSEEMVNKCFVNIYDGNTYYQIWILTNDYTFDKVDRGGILDAKFVFSNKDGYINASISRDLNTNKLKILSYTPPIIEEDATWECDGDEPVYVKKNEVKHKELDDFDKKLLNAGDKMIENYISRNNIHEEIKQNNDFVEEEIDEVYNDDLPF